MAVADGSRGYQDLKLEGQGGTTITRLSSDTLEVIDEPLVLDEGSMGHIAADLNGQRDVLVPGPDRIVFAVRL